MVLLILEKPDSVFLVLEKLRACLTDNVLIMYPDSLLSGTHICGDKKIISV